MFRTGRPWLQRSPLFRSAVLASTLVLAANPPAQAASDFAPLPGTWIVSAEQDGKPGRGMAIDVQDGVLVMQVYNYRANGTATFHLAVGSIDGNQVSAPLKSYRGGRSFGSGPLSGVEDGDAGEVRIEFTSATQAQLQFPGEPTVAIQRFRFDSAPDSALPLAYWMMSMQNDSGTAVHSALALTGLDSSSGPAMVVTMPNGSEVMTACSYSATLQGFNCSNGSAMPAIRLQFQTALRQMSGSAQIDGSNYQLVGQRLFSPDGYDSLMFSDYPPVPASGTWIVTGEKNGQPGRGMAIDVQTGTLVMQVYNYQADGNATFHLGVGAFANGQASAPLKSYQGGRYFGSGPRSGTEASSAGDVFLDFSSPTRGHIRFPGEGAVAIERFQFAPVAPDPASLLGNWTFHDRTNKETAHVALTQVDGNTATTAGGGVRCSFLNPATAQVRCVETFTISGRGTVYLKDYRFVLQTDMGAGKALTAGELARSDVLPDDSSTANNSLLALRTMDRRGMKLGLGNAF